MSDVKGAIDSLCKYLHFGVNVQIKPEHFKMAKFNTDNMCTVSNKLLSTYIDNNNYIATIHFNNITSYIFYSRQRLSGTLFTF